LAKKTDWIASAFWDNSGVLRFNDDWLVATKCETHNSPSNEEPYGGALTGIVGVYRDLMGTGQGARLIWGTYGFCTGEPNYTGNLRPKIGSRRLLEGVRRGEHTP
jgi:phosphoribosylformylglycinamidine synthase